MDIRSISHYRVVRRLGVGGMGEVFLAEDTKLERSAAIKLMSVELAKDPNQRKRFRTEAKAASRLTHPNICTIYEVGETEDSRPFLAMEYVDGQTLDVVQQQRRLNLREIIELAIETAEALETAHSQGIVHRDIKPANIMLDRRGHVKVLDFGLAKRFEKDELSLSTTSLAHTKSGMLLGTPHYMSPEQALGREVAPSTDIFSLGVVVYELIVGQRPFLGRTVGETINNVVNQPPQPLALENPLFSPALDQVVLKCLEKDPQKRYPSAKALVEDLIPLKKAAERPVTAATSPAGAGAPAPKLEIALASAATPPLKPHSKVKLVLAGAAGATVLLVGAGLWFLSWHLHGRAIRNQSESRAGAGAAFAQNSVAVLPFDNFSGEPDTDYLSDGLTEEITTALSRINGLKVAARNSAFTFKGKKEDAREVGASLHVSTLLEGSIRKDGRQIRVSAQLINAADGFHLWSETYDRSIDDLFAVQEDIASRIAQRLQGVTNAQPALAPTVVPEAHQLYLQARLFWNKRTETSLKRAIQLFQEAINHDANYAAAYAGLAATYIVLPDYSADAKFSEYRPLARTSANRALDLDPHCAEAHAVLGSLQAAALDNQGAEEHFRKAIELAPNYATAHHWYGQFLVQHGRRQEALAELQTALDLDPLSPILHCTIPDWYLLGRDYDRAIEESHKVIEAFPEFPHARGPLIAALIKKGQFKDALAEIDQMRALLPEEPLAELDLKGYALARLGQKDEARKVLATLEEQRSLGRQLDGAIAFVYLGLRDYDRSCDAFEKLVATEGLDQEVLCDPFFDEVRDLPRFKALLKKAGIVKD